jgi:endonuclease I
MMMKMKFNSLFRGKYFGMKPILSRYYLCFLLVLATLVTQGQIPNGYYSNAEGKTGAELKTVLYNIIKNHTEISYSALWTAFQNTDKKPNGKVWDMYSDKPGSTPPYEFTFVTDQCGNYSVEGDCYNREHSFPKSWFNDGTPMYTDLFHLYPTDGKVNGQRGNYPFGEVSSPTWTSLNGSKLGPSSYPGYTGVVFEPIDDYKGDFARSYFYMVTRYEDKVANWSSDMLNSTAYPAFSTWAKNMLLEWNAQDPVSQKEIDRNNVVYSQYQHNRNPFIDHPEYAQLIWGSYTPVSFTSTPNTEAQVGIPYTYSITTAGTSGASITITPTSKPSWATLTTTGNGTATLTGTPGAANVGSNGVTLTASDGTTTANQTFTINVSPADIATTSDLAKFRIYPNPVSDVLHIEASEVKMFSVEIFDLIGKTIYTKDKIMEPVEVEMANFPKGIYMVKILANGKTYMVKVVKR